MQTPRPDRFTYPDRGSQDDPAEIAWKSPWRRVAFIGGLLGIAVVGAVVAFA